MKKIAEGNSTAQLHNFEYNPSDYINNPLVFNLKKTSEYQMLDRIIENLPKENHKYCVQHKKASNMFMIKQDPNQREKDDLFALILKLDKKLALSRKAKNDRNVKALIRFRKVAVIFLKELDEEYVKTS